MEGGGGNWKVGEPPIFLGTPLSPLSEVQVCTLTHAHTHGDDAVPQVLVIQVNERKRLTSSPYGLPLKNTKRWVF